MENKKLCVVCDINCNLLPEANAYNSLYLTNSGKSANILENKADHKKVSNQMDIAETIISQMLRKH